jgi:hypothetical protein
LTDELTPAQCEALAHFLAPLLTALLEEKRLALPFEVRGESAGNIVFYGEVNAHGEFRDLFDFNRKLRGRFPLDIRVNDRNGNTWTVSVSESDLRAM